MVPGDVEGRGAASAETPASRRRGATSKRNPSRDRSRRAAQ